MSAELRIAGYLRVADEDLRGARLLHAGNNRNAVYLCEQAAEKIIRAVLTSEGLHGGTKHELADLVDLVPDANPLKRKLRAVEHLAMYATAYRYPTSQGRIKPGPNAQELSDVLQRIAELLEEVARRFEVDLERADGPAGRIEPIR